MIDIFLPTCRGGTVFGPVRTAVGGFLSGVAGGVGGAIVGDKVVGEVAGYATNAIHSTGTTVKSVISTTGEWIKYIPITTPPTQLQPTQTTQQLKTTLKKLKKKPKPNKKIQLTQKHTTTQ